MGRQPCCDKVGLKKGPWTTDEDKKLINFILTNGQCCWRALPKLAGLLRCGKSCRLRWTNYLRPDLKRGLLSEDEELLVIQLHSQLGNRWSKIASHLPGRTDNEIKNHWNTHIKKKLKKMGIDPFTHKPLPSPSPSPIDDQEQNDQETEANNVQQEELDAKKSPVSQLVDDFCIDEVPLIQSHEILTPSTSSPTSFSSSSSSSNSELSFIINNDDNNNNNIIINNKVNDMGFWDDDFMSSMDLLLNDYDSDKGLLRFETDCLTNYSKMVLDEECLKYEQLL